MSQCADRDARVHWQRSAARERTATSRGPAEGECIGPLRLVGHLAGEHGGNSPALQRWGSPEEGRKVPAGTEEPVLSSLAGLCPDPAAHPAMNRWAMVKTAWSTNRIGRE